ncbi:MAG TPA: fructose bisphosphate aldolase [Acidisoma sp.]|nr:fructose bisphosphate aldolase [Acidisoma sp.]
MSNSKMMAQISGKGGFVAALDQSGGSTPEALRAYGVPDSAYSGDEEMFQVMHEMRVRIITSPVFSGDKVIGAILFERTMEGEVNGQPVSTYLWEKRGVVPFLKVDKGREGVEDGVNLMKPIVGLDALLERAIKLGIFGTKMRSVIHLPSKTGIAAVVAQQFDVAAQISKHGLVPIIEPEVLIECPDKQGAEALLLQELKKGLDAWKQDGKVMLKVTIPDVPGRYAPLIADPRVMRVIALSGGYTRDDACRRLAENQGMIASFSRALVEDLKHDMSAAEFDAALDRSIDEIYRASVGKRGKSN